MKILRKLFERSSSVVSEACLPWNKFRALGLGSLGSTWAHSLTLWAEGPLTGLWFLRWGWEGHDLPLQPQYVGPSRVSLQSHSFLPPFCFCGSLLLPFSSSWPICIFWILLPCSYNAVWMWSPCLFNDPLALTYLFTYMYWYMYLCFFRFFPHLGCYITWAEVLCYVVGPCCLSILNIAVCTCPSQTP